MECLNPTIASPFPSSNVLIIEPSNHNHHHHPDCRACQSPQCCAPTLYRWTTSALAGVKLSLTSAVLVVRCDLCAGCLWQQDAGGLGGCWGSLQPFFQHIWLDELDLFHRSR